MARTLLLCGWLLLSTNAAAQTFGGVYFEHGAASFADTVNRFEPFYGGGPRPSLAGLDARQVLGVPEQGGIALGNGGRITVKFLDNRLTGSGDSGTDLRIFEVGAPETVHVEISKDGRNWFSVGTATGFAAGIDIDQYGFDRQDRFAYVRLTDDGDSPSGEPFVQGADLVAIGAESSVPGRTSRDIIYTIQAHVGGRSRLIVRGSTLQWHHLLGTAPGRGNGFWSFDTAADSPTIVDSNQGPNIGWMPTGWPPVLGDGTHPEAYSSTFSSLTPVLPGDDTCWYVKKVSGSGSVKIVEQPDRDNDYAVVVAFDDIGPGNIDDLAGTGFYTVRLIQTDRSC
jgi:hypothetical protein